MIFTQYLDFLLKNIFFLIFTKQNKKMILEGFITGAGEDGNLKINFL